MNQRRNSNHHRQIDQNSARTIHRRVRELKYQSPRRASNRPQAGKNILEKQSNGFNWRFDYFIFNAETINLIIEYEEP